MISRKDFSYVRLEKSRRFWPHPPVGHAQAERDRLAERVMRRQGKPSILHLRAEMLNQLEAGIRVSWVCEKRLEVAGGGVDQIALHHHRSVERQVVQLDRHVF